jgi:hypothetical protein
MNILEIVTEELTQISAVVHLSVEYTSYLPTAVENHLNTVCFHKQNIDRYWLPWEERFGAWIKADGSEVVMVVRKDAIDINAEDLSVGFTSVLAGICLNLQGQVAIHANAVSLEGSAVIFVGESGMGKSTLSAYCVNQGAGFITDDVLIINAKGLVVPGNARIKLYPHTGMSLGLDTSEKTNYKIFYTPEQLGAKKHERPVPLSIIYLLAESDDYRVYSQQLSPTQAVYDLLANSYIHREFIADRPQLLDLYLSATKKAPVKKLFYPRDFRILPKVYDFLLEEIHRS